MGPSVRASPPYFIRRNFLCVYSLWLVVVAQDFKNTLATLLRGPQF